MPARAKSHAEVLAPIITPEQLDLDAVAETAGEVRTDLSLPLTAQDALAALMVASREPDRNVGWIRRVHRPSGRGDGWGARLSRHGRQTTARTQSGKPLD